LETSNGWKRKKAPPDMERLLSNTWKKDYYFLVHSVFFAQHAFEQSAPHFFASVPFVQAVHSAFLSAFFAEHPQLSQANAAVPATNNAIMAILIILFIVGTPLVIFPTLI
jgi:hypothetical protein